jgi:phenylalanyl-tRNA synthetase beta chain
VRLFETGTVFSRSRGERPYAGWVLSGSRGAHWSGNAGPLGFSDTKGLAELLASSAGRAIGVVSGDDLPWLVRGQAARLLVGDEPAGWVGRIAGGDLTADPVFAGEIDLEILGLGAARAAAKIAALPRYPSIVRDLSILVDERLPAVDVRGTIRSSAPAALVSVHEFDRYQGAGVPAGQVSLSLRLTFRDRDRTLTDAEVQQAIDAIVGALERDHRATLRGK